MSTNNKILKLKQGIVYRDGLLQIYNKTDN